MAPLDFAIASLPVSAGRLGISPMPGRTGDAAADWQHLIDWAPDIVISMTQDEEFPPPGADSFLTRLRAEGIAWHHCPVPDFSAPASADAFAPAEQAALRALQSGQKVLVHCFGGCGRSGMMCLRLMIGAGEDSAVALTRLRSVRPCAVETDAQAAWARRRAAR